MGDAKRRGPREQRVQEGIQKAQEAEIARRKALAEAEAALTPEQRAKRARAQKLLAFSLGLIATPYGK